MRGGCEGERERVGRTEQEALFKDAPPFPLEVCPSGGPGDWGGEEGGGRALVGRGGNVVGGDGVGGGVDAGGREGVQEGKGGRKGTSRRRGRQEGKWETGLPGVWERCLAHLGHLVESTSLTSPQLDTLLLGLPLWGHVDSPPRMWGKWTRPKEGLRRGVHMTDISGPAKFA